MPRRAAHLLCCLLAWITFGPGGSAFSLTASSSPPAVRLTFNLPADTAGKSLLRFSTQSGQEVLFATQVVAGVTTKPVHGDYAVMEAAKLMLEGTGLEAVQTEPNGVLSVRRKPPEPMITEVIAKLRRALVSALLLFSGQLMVRAQDQISDDTGKHTGSASTAPAAGVVNLSPFEVTSTQGEGYVANDAVAGLKSRQMLIDIPQSIQIVPRDIIDDLGQFNSTIDTIKYVSSGVIPYAYGEVVFQRGFRSGNPLIDGQQDQVVVADPVSYDSIEVLKGPAAVLYGQRADLAGIINKHTRKPLPVEKRSVRTIIGSGGLYRGEWDLTGPIGKIGSTAVTYRVYGALQKYDGFQPVDFDNRTVFGAGLKFDFNSNINLLLQSDYLDDNMRGISNNFQNAAATDVYHGPGYSMGYKSRWSNTHYNRVWYKATLSIRFNDHWDMVSTMMANTYYRNDREVRNAGMPNFTTNTIPQYFFGYNYYVNMYGFQTDVLGQYTLAGIKNQSNMGFSVDQDYNGTRFWLPGAIGPNFNTSITSPTVMDIAMPAYTASNSNAPTNNGRLNRYAYYMHTVTLFDDKLSFVAGLSTAYLRDGTRTTTTMETKGTPRRLGVVYKPIEGLAFFVNNSTAFRGQGANTFAGVPFPPVQGEVTEGGIKTAFAQGRVSTTFTYFSLEVSNLPSPDPNHVGFSLPAGTQRNRGYEADIALRPLPHWQLIGSLYSGNILGVDGKRMPSSINHSSSILTKYDFESGTLKGLTFGASMFHSGDRAGAPWNAYTVYGLFAGYGQKHWQVMVNMDNLTDEFYSSGGWGGQYMDVAPPRNSKVTFTYRF